MLQLNKVKEEYEKLKNKAINEDKDIKSSLKWKKAVNDLTLAKGC